MSKKPYKANGETSDPREQICWDFYVESITKNQANAYESAIKAGYSHHHAKNITLQGWFKDRLESLERKEMLSKAEKVLKKTLDYSTDEIDEQGKTKVKIDLLKIQVDASKHITSTLGKDKGYSTRNEHSGVDGKPLQIIIPQQVAEAFNIENDFENKNEDEIEKVFENLIDNQIDNQTENKTEDNINNQNAINTETSSSNTEQITI